MKTQAQATKGITLTVEGKGDIFFPFTLINIGVDGSGSRLTFKDWRKVDTITPDGIFNLFAKYVAKSAKDSMTHKDSDSNYGTGKMSFKPTMRKGGTWHERAKVTVTYRERADSPINIMVQAIRKERDIALTEMAFSTALDSATSVDMKFILAHAAKNNIDLPQIPGLEKKDQLKMEATLCKVPHDALLLHGLAIIGLAHATERVNNKMNNDAENKRNHEEKPRRTGKGAPKEETLTLESGVSK